MHKPEFRLTSSSRQDRSATEQSCARTTDKGNENRWIYSLVSRYNLTKRELTKRNQNVRTAKIFFMGALGSSNNRLHGKLSAVAA